MDDQAPDNNTNNNTNSAQGVLGGMLDLSDPVTVQTHLDAQNRIESLNRIPDPIEIASSFPTRPVRRSTKLFTVPRLSSSSGSLGKKKKNSAATTAPEVAIEVSQPVLKTKAVKYRAYIERLPEELLLKIFHIVADFNLGDLITLTSASPIFTRIGLDFTLWPLDLDLSQCHDRISDSIFLSLAPGFSNIRSLNLKKCSNITDITLAYVGKFCVALKEIDFSLCSNITSRGIFSMFNHGTLTDQLSSLNFNNCSKIDYRSLLYIDKFCGNLSVLNLSGCPLVPSSLIALKDKAGPSVTTLKLNQLQNLGPKNSSNLVESFINVKCLSLYKCPKVDDAFLTVILPELSLEELNIAQTKVSDSSMLMIQQYLGPTLRILNISKCKKVKNVLPVCPNLVRLDACLCKLHSLAFHALSHNTALTWLNVRNNNPPENEVEDGSTLLSIAASGYTQRLETLWLGYTSKKHNPFWDFTSAEIRSICTSSPNLVSFKLPRMTALDASVFDSFGLLDNLRILDISHIPHFVTNQQAETLVDNDPFIEELNIQGCIHTSIETLAILTGLIDPQNVPAEFSEEEEDDDFISIDWENDNLFSSTAKSNSLANVYNVLGENLPNIAVWSKSHKLHILTPPINETTRKGLSKLSKFSFQLCPKIPIPIVDDLKIYFSRVNLSLYHI